MKVVNSEAIYENENKYVRVSIISDEVPSPMPTAADIPGYDDSFSIYPGSTIYVVGNGALYMCGEHDNWVQQ